MIYIIQNDLLTVKINSIGAELYSIKHQNGCEYLWQGDPIYWGEHAPWLFPICSHLWEDSYLYRGNCYRLRSRSFIHKTDFTPIEQTNTTLTLTLSSNDESRREYPFDYTFTVCYRLSGNRLLTDVTVHNTGKVIMPFSFGAHPGFRAPIDENGRFEDWYLEFDKLCSPDEILLTSNVYLDGRRTAFPLQNGKILRLSHKLFTLDGRFLARMSNRVTLKSSFSSHFVTVHFPQTPYLGLWSKPNSDAPLLCIEPWHGLPSYDGILDDLEAKNDMYRLMPNTQKKFSLEYTFG